MVALNSIFTVWAGLCAAAVMGKPAKTSTTAVSTTKCTSTTSHSATASTVAVPKCAIEGQTSENPSATHTLANGSAAQCYQLCGINGLCNTWSWEPKTSLCSFYRGEFDDIVTRDKKSGIYFAEATCGP